MSNGRIQDAEIELELSGDRRSIDKLLLTGQKEMKSALSDLTSEMRSMRQVCEDRAAICPGVHLADPVTPMPGDDKRTWAMWSIGLGTLNFLKQIAVPILVAIITVKLLT